MTFFQYSEGSDLNELLHLKIFDRWGALVYEGKNIMPNSSKGLGWQGKGTNGGQWSIYLYCYFIDGGWEIPATFRICKFDKVNLFFEC